MGRTLQRTACSTNIKERLDFSCAIFAPDGSLVANAPHLPVHLGAMQEAVKFQINHLGAGWSRSDVLVSNHPQAGGSHLPDITVISPVWDRDVSEGGRPIFYVASRGHHADVGGLTPGSMPPFSKSLLDEGIAIKSFKIIRGGEFQESELLEILRGKQEEPNREGGLFKFYPWVSIDKKKIDYIFTLKGSRCVEDNVADLKA